MKYLERSLDSQNQVWKYILVFLGAFVGGQVLGSIPVLCIIIYNVITSDGLLDPAYVMDVTILGMSKNTKLFLLLLIPLAGFVLVVFLIKKLHKRTFAETVNGTQKVRIDRCLTGMVVWGILLAIYLLGDYLFDNENYTLQFDFSKFIPLLLLSVVLIPFQTTLEELLFRGYLAQGIADRTKSRWCVILIPGLIFGLMHTFNPEVKEFGFWAVMPQYIFFGFFFGLIAVLDDGIELSMGIHAANNIFLSLFVTHSSSVLQTDAFLEQHNLSLIKETVSLIIMGIVALIYLAWKYKWNFRILNMKVEPLANETILSFQDNKYKQSKI
jgi:membrane protease YdiL (CAAX protease family)